MIIKKEDHSTGLGDGIKTFLIENLTRILRSTLLRI